MKTFAFYNAKGGVGKTSSAVNVAYILAAVHNKRTLLIDLDRLRDVGSFFGMGGDGQLGSYTIGAVAGRGKFGFTGEYSIPYGSEPEDAPV